MPLLLKSDSRKKLAIEPDKVYPEMFKAIEQKNWSKFGKALELLDNLIDEIDKSLSIKLSVLLEIAHQQRNVKIAKRNTYRLIISSAKVLLKEVLKNPDINQKNYCRQAFKELQTLKQTNSKYAKLDFVDEFSDILDNLHRPKVLRKIILKIIAKIDALAFK